MTKTIVLIGAGSAAFTQGLLADLVLSKKPWHLRLVDVDPRALEVGEGLARQMARARNAEITVESSTDRCDMLPGADVVVTTIGVGGRRAWEIDFKLPREFGVFQPVADTAMAGGMGQPLNVMQLLWINLISDIFPGLALALEPPEPDVLSRPPRDPREQIIKTGDFKRILFEASTISAGSLAAYGYGLARYGQGPQAGSMAFMSLCTGQLMHAISCRSETHSMFDADQLAPNRYLTVALAGSLGMQALTLIVPGLRRFLGLNPLSLMDAAVAAGSAIAPLLVNEATKRITVPQLPSNGGAAVPAPEQVGNVSGSSLNNHDAGSKSNEKRLHVHLGIGNRRPS